MPVAPTGRTVLCVLLGTLSTLLAVLLLSGPGTPDVAIFGGWIETIRRDGLVAGYAHNATVQMPLYAVIFALLGRCADLFQISVIACYKASLFISWLATGVCLRRWTSDGVLIWTILLALLPNVALGYFDIYHAPLLLIALWAAREDRWRLFSLMFAIFFLIKAQTLILAPFVVAFAIETLRRKGSKAQIAQMVAPAAAIIAVIFLVFGRDLVLSGVRAASHNYISGNALNVGWLVTHWLRAAHPDWFGPLQSDGSAAFIEFVGGGSTPVPVIAMRAAFIATYVFLLAVSWKLMRTLEGFVFAMFVGFLAYFALNVGVHENHLFYAALLSVILYLMDRRFAVHTLFACLAATVNMVLFYGVTGEGLPFSRVIGIDLALPLAALNVAFFGVCAWQLLVESRRVSVTQASR
jgi:hypothetical protein